MCEYVCGEMGRVGGAGAYTCLHITQFLFTLLAYLISDYALGVFVCFRFLSFMETREDLQITHF